MYDQSIVKNSNNWTMDEAHKNELDINMLKHNEVNFEVTFETPRCGWMGEWVDRWVAG